MGAGGLERGEARAARAAQMCEWREAAVPRGAAGWREDGGVSWLPRTPSWRTSSAGPTVRSGPVRCGPVRFGPALTGLGGVGRRAVCYLQVKLVSFTSG